MNKILIFLIYLSISTGCSLNKNSKFWTETKNIPQDENSKYKEIFVEEEALSKELNTNLPINFGNIINNDFSIKNYFNNDGRLNYNGALKKSSRYKFSKIKKFHQF